MSATTAGPRFEQAAALGHEARATADDHLALRLWLRLLATTTEIEEEIRRRLRRQFGISLARFDYLAQLHRRPEGLTMKALSRCLMVTGGNITGLTDELADDGVVERLPSPTDGRSGIVRLTPRGRRGFATMARAHERWVLELFAGLDARVIARLHEHLGMLRGRLARRTQEV